MTEHILTQLSLPAPDAVTRLKREEDDTFYDVWHLDYPDRSCILKKAKGREAEVYKTYFTDSCPWAPALLAVGNVDGADWLVTEFVSGNDMLRCTREDLTLALDSLIAMQRRWWGGQPGSLVSRCARKEYLKDSQLERAYDAYLADAAAIPHTLCHDDLLPFNVRISGDRAVLIDWEVAGILPYPTSLARLIAHGEEDENALFYMKNEDKTYAIAYYYDHFVRHQGIDYEVYRRSLELTLFYEYCEWVYVGNKYDETDSDRFRAYLQKAKGQAAMLGF